MTQPDLMQLKSIALHDGTDTPEWVPNNTYPGATRGRRGCVT
ncbi:MAG: hypothetical protein ACRD0V_15930 [Acidimicrobiales bacterium]